MTPQGRGMALAKARGGGIRTRREVLRTWRAAVRAEVLTSGRSDAKRSREGASVTRHRRVSFMMAGWVFI